MGNNLSSYHSFEGAKWGMPGLDIKNTGAPDDRKYIWEADQTYRNVYGQINNPLLNAFNTAVLLLPDMWPFEDCRRSALDRAVTAQSDYRTLPVIGYDPNDHHHWFTMGRKHNAFNPESQSDNIDTKYAVDRMRITQVNI
jgi:hypothetical protein